MKQTKIIMGMPITVEIVDLKAKKDDFNKVFSYFSYIDNKFSTYRQSSEISRINKDELVKEKYSEDMKKVLSLSENTKKETEGYFNIEHLGKLDPSGLVKGWSIFNASLLLKKKGFKNFYIDAGGDVQVYGKNKEGKKWRVGIRNPFNREENIKIVSIFNLGVATSGTQIRGQHIWNPFNNREIKEIVSITVIGPNIYEADRFATAAFAMGKKGIKFIEFLKGFEGYMIESSGIATLTSGFEKYIC